MALETAAVLSEVAPSPALAVAFYDLPETSTLDIYWRACVAARIQKRTQYRMKRLIDLILATLLLVVLAPLLLVICITIKLTSRGPVLYRQQRLMQNGFEFTLLKFRTMIDGAERMLDQVFHLNEASGPLFKSRQDPRITRVGRVLRSTFLDELPQLINVIRGEMSLVGPRPCLAHELAQMEKQFLFRFGVPQGLTGPWQTHGHHAITIDQQLRLEREYVSTWSLRKDFDILVRTVFLVVGRRGI